MAVADVRGMPLSVLFWYDAQHFRSVCNGYFFIRYCPIVSAR